MAYSGTATGNPGTPIGRLIGIPVTLGSGVHMSLRDAAAVTFLITENGGDTAIAFKESIDGANEQILPIVTEFYAGNGAGGVLTKQAQAADDAWAKSNDAGQVMVAITIRADQLSPGFNAVECTLDGGTCIAFTHDLLVQRTPANLRAVNVT